MSKEERRTGRAGSEPEDRAVYIISVAAELAGVHPQTLRIYERRGLLRPARTAGNTRRYSERDIARLRMIQHLTQEQGLNLAGVKMIVEMEDELDRLRERVRRIDQDMVRARRRMQDELDRLRQDTRRAEIVPMSAVPKLRIRVRAASGEQERRGPIPIGPVS
jgi:MerR family transcriptional regulator/heat shock protein HspR